MRWRRLILLLFLAFVGFLCGLLVGAVAYMRGQPLGGTTRNYPLPHHVPKYPGGVTLRFAMVHDVIHERYPRHGEAYYRERNRQVRESLKQKGETRDEESFALMDDLGAGLDFLKQDDEAVTVLREKLQDQQRVWQTERQFYTTYANLGTFLIHGNFQRAMSGDAASRQRVREGLDFIRKAIVVNPEAHFGREIWQAVTVEFLLSVIEKPGLLLEFDMIGDCLDEEVDPSRRRPIRDAQAYGMGGANQSVAESLEGKPSQHGYPPEIRKQFTTHVGSEADWDKLVATSQHFPVPFDEPVLGIIGMWRLGGGANPHFALALGEIMLRVGQRYIAWNAYELAVLLADRFWSDEEIQTRLVTHCRERQQLIESQLPREEVAMLRTRFEGELAFGQQYQRAYQDYEERRIREGMALDDEHFYDQFNKDHPPIASPVGTEDAYVVQEDGVNLPMGILGAGCFAFLGACLVRLRDRWRARRLAKEIH